MRKIALWEARNPRKVILIALLIAIPALIGFLLTKVNYDIMSYLPEDLEAVQGEKILDEVFNDAGMSFVIVKDMPAKYTAELKTEIEQIEGVSKVIWIDTLTDISVPREILPDVLENIFYSIDGSETMMLVQYDSRGESETSLNAIAEIKHIMNEKCFITGISAVVEDTKEICETQAFFYIGVAVVLALAVMALMMESWVQPLVILVSLGIAVIYNMGTNFFMGSISFITQSVAAVLQLGVTMDYSIFLIDRYHDERPNFDTREEAMAEAVSKSFTALAGSSLTTVFGFAALCFMQLTLGFDIGFVMAKGVVFGVLVVIFVLPAILIMTDDFIVKFRHKSVLPEFEGFASFVVKRRRILALIFLVLLAPTYFMQRNLDKYYDMNKALPDYLTSIAGLEELKNEFGVTSMQFVIVDDSLPADRIIQMEREISKLDGINMLLAYNSIVGSSIPDDIIPDEILDICKQGGLQVFLVNSELDQASEEFTQQLRAMNKIVKSYDPNGMITGEGSLVQALMATTEVDFAVTAVLSTVAIFILIAICFKSISLPVILVSSIELSIWINLSISKLLGAELSFIDPTVVNCVQLGATVDYAILLTTKFKEEINKDFLPSEAMKKAVSSSMRSICQSAAVFFAACFGVYLVCDINMIRGICVLLARGAIISCLVIALFLAPVLCVSEKFISKTTKEWR